MIDAYVGRYRQSGIAAAEAIAAFHSPATLIETWRLVVGVPFASKNLKPASSEVGLIQPEKVTVILGYGIVIDVVDSGRCITNLDMLLLPDG